MNVYFDASVIVTLLLAERQRDEWLEWLATARPIAHVSSFGVGEIMAAIAAKTRRGDLSTEQGRLSQESVQTYLGSRRIVDTLDIDIRTAARFAAQPDLAIKLPDAIHLAIAQRLGMPLASRDAQQLAAARRLGIAVAELPTI